MSPGRSALSPSVVRNWRLVAICVVVASVVAWGGLAAPKAYADNYPSWADVQAARSNEAAKQVEVTAITNLVQTLKTQVKAAEDLAIQREKENEVAQAALAVGKDKADRLAARSTALKATAEASRREAAVVGEKLARSGGPDLLGTLLTSSAGNTDALLSRLSSMGRLTATVNGIYSKAAQDDNLAKAASEQAASAKNELTVLAAKAQAEAEKAAAAQKQMIAALQAETAHEGELQAQLASLTSATAITEQQYQAGVAARAAAAAAAAAAARARARSGDAGPISSDAQALAQELMGYVDSGQLVGSYPDHIFEIRWIAEGRSVPNCGIDTSVLQAMVIAEHMFSSVGVSDINRRCTGQIEGAGIYSQHYMNGGGHAVDFYSLGGQGTNGADSNALALIRTLDNFMPYGSGLGQRQCRLNAGDEPGLRHFQDFYDTCNHLHVNDPM
ncbi:coiled-coil domain-containing protein [Leifsonia shinshuensis]